MDCNFHRRISFSRFRYGHASLTSNSGFVLMEIMLALTIFSISVLGLVSALNDTLGVSNNLHRAQVIRAGLESILSEAKQRDEIEEMKLESTDQNKGITYRTEIEEVRLANESGEDLDGLYVLRATATYLVNGQEQQEKAEVYVNMAKAAETPATDNTATQAGSGTYGNLNAAQAGNNNNANGNGNGGRNNGGRGNGANGGNNGGRGAGGNNGNNNNNNGGGGNNTRGNAGGNFGPPSQ